MTNKHFNARRRYDSEIFLRSRDVFEILDEIFKNSNRARNARVKYNELIMSFTMFFVEFYVEFILLINQLINCSKEMHMKDLKNKISNTLTRIIVNSELFTTLKQYKKHLQITNEKLKNLRRVFKFNDRKVNFKNNKLISKNVAKIIESLMRVLFKQVKLFIDLQKQVITNVINELCCWNCDDSYRLKDCFHTDKKNQWIQKRYKKKLLV